MENKEKFVSTNDLEDGVTGRCTIRRRPSVGRKAITKPFKVATLDSCQSAKAGHERERERAGPGKRSFECVGHQQARL